MYTEILSCAAPADLASGEYVFDFAVVFIGVSSPCFDMLS
jgi:hypothetical protein